MGLPETARARIAAAIARVGEPVTLTQAGTPRTVTAVVSVLWTTRRYHWFTAAEASAWTLPALLVRIAGDDPAAVGDTFSRDGRTFSVKKIERTRVSGVVVQTVLMCA